MKLVLFKAKIFSTVYIYRYIFILDILIIIIMQNKIFTEK